MLGSKNVEAGRQAASLWRMRFLNSAVLRVGGLLAVSLAGGVTHAVEVPDEHNVIPILLRRCVICHGGEYQEGGLDLRTVESIRTGGKSGSAIKDRDPDGSLLILKLVADEMPPEKDRGRAGIEVVPESELNALRRWIAAGAPEGKANPARPKRDAAGLWSFKPVRRPQVPKVKHGEDVVNPIDAFLLRKLEAAGLRFSPLADPETLLRRLAFDVTGLPPRAEDVKSFRSGKNSYNDMIGRMLASPRYGERWGRFWLDLAGYADSEGKRQADMIRAFAWKYRDYVIRSFNADKPYDRFLTEQIAGDELADYDAPDAITETVFDNLVATGFLRMAPDGTTANPVNRVVDRIDVIADELDILARGVLGLTLDCARCHDHKYDPLTQRDYYALRAIFKGAYDEYDWMTPQAFSNQWEKMRYRQLPVSLPRERSAWKAKLAAHSATVGPLQAQLKKLDSKTNDARTLRKKIAALEKGKPVEPMIRGLWDRGRPSPTYVYRRGDHLLAGAPVSPNIPAALGGRIPFEIRKPWPDANQTGRRLAFAKWLTDRRNPLTARVAVNRIWKHHFGRGLVESLDNFGTTGTPPSHPDLLDWLASEFMDNGWSMRHIHRLILNSRAWQQASRVTEAHRRHDPENVLISRVPMRRMDAEQVHDSLLVVAGVLNETPYGAPDPVTVRADGLVTAVERDGAWRRSVYVRQRRKEMPTLLETFDLPAMNPNCSERSASTVVTQPLQLLNSEAVHTLASRFAERLESDVGGDQEAQIRRAYALALSREPTGREFQLARESLAAFIRYRENIEGEPEDSRPASVMALGDFCHTLLNSAAFLYID
jgi:hypothetical protein